MDYLFRGQDGFTFFEQKRRVLIRHIDTLLKDELDINDDSLKLIYNVNYSIKTIELGEIRRTDEGEIEIDITNDPRYGAYYLRDLDRSPKHVKGRRIAIHIPFVGDPELFNVRPSTFTTVFPRANVDENELVFYCDFNSSVDTGEQIENNITREIELIQRWVGYVNNDVTRFNNSIDSIIDEVLKTRREKISKDDQLLKQIGVTEKRKTSLGFIKPVSKIALKIRKSSGTVDADQAIELGTYNEIVSSVNQIGIDLERASRELRDLDEEPLRDTILLGLNQSFSGIATSEAFNKEGRTDILIKHEGKVLYVAECKIWNDEKRFNDGVDQLLSYLTWRDTKTSYIVFSKNVDVTGVITKTERLLDTHPNYLRKEAKISESCVRYVFKQKADSSQECYLTLHVFDLGARH